MGAFNISEDGQNKLNVTSSLHVSAHDILVCGRNDGSILFLAAIEATMKLLFGQEPDKGKFSVSVQRM